MRKLVYLLLVIVSLEAYAQVPGAGVRKGEPAGFKKPKLVIAIVADQFRYDYLLRFRQEYKGGLDQLLTRGAVFTNARYQHFPTFTSVGHSTLLTGAYPSISGIIGNTWYDRQTGKPVPSAFDENAQQVGGSGGRGASARNLQVSTVGDELKTAGKGKNRVIGISFKDYAGILSTGHAADAVYWFDGKAGNFVSSTYYISELPKWVQDFNASRPADRYKGMEWQGTKLADEVGPKLYGMLPGTAFGSELLEQMAETAVKSEQLGRDSDTDLLVVSFSSNDYVGHNYGPDSEQVRAISIATDRILGKFFKFIDSQIGMSNVTVVFAADHGVSPMPEANAERRMPGGRISFNTIRDAVLKGLQEKFGEGKWIAAVAEEAIYLDWNFIKSRNLTPDVVAEQAAHIARGLPNVFRVYTRAQLLNGTAMTDQVGRCLMNGYSSSRGGDLYILLDPYYFFGGGRTTTHGSAFGYDTHVPVIFMGSGIKAGRYHQTIAVNDIAPTLSTILDIEIPSGSEGRILSEILVGR